VYLIHLFNLRLGFVLEQTHSLPSFGLRVGWCELANAKHSRTQLKTNKP